MNSLNSILIEGNLVKDPEYKLTPKGIEVCNFVIASNRFYKKEESDSFEQEVSYFNVTTWNKLAKRCNERLKKGRGVRIIGRLKQDRWIDSEEKVKSKVYIIANDVQFKPVFKKIKIEEDKNI
jgi:single-strand DNA-binding protein